MAAPEPLGPPRPPRTDSAWLSRATLWVGCEAGRECTSRPRSRSPPGCTCQKWQVNLEKFSCQIWQEAQVGVRRMPSASVTAMRRPCASVSSALHLGMRRRAPVVAVVVRMHARDLDLREMLLLLLPVSGAVGGVPERVRVARAVLGHAERAPARGRGLIAGLRPCAHIRVEHTQLKNSTQRVAGAKKGQARAVRWFEARMEDVFVARNTCAESSIMLSNVIIFSMSKNDCMVVSTKPYTLKTPKTPWSSAAKSSKTADSRDATIASDASFSRNICRPP